MSADDDIRLMRERLEDLEVIMKDANVGTWRIELSENHLPRMQMDDMLWNFLSIDVTGQSPEDIYELWISMIRKPDVPKVNAAIQEMLRIGKAESFYIINHPQLGEQYVRWGGRARHVEGLGYVLVGYHKIVTDVVGRIRASKDEVAKAMRAAENANLEKSRFFHDLSQDISYSMECITDYEQKLEAEIGSSSLGSDNLRKIRQVGSYVKDVMGGVSDLFAGETVEKHVFHEPIDLNEVARNVADTVISIVNRKNNQNFNNDIQIIHNMVLSDPKRLRRIMTFLLGRAMISTAEGGSIHVSVYEEPCSKEGCLMYVARITDDGVGVPYDRTEDDSVLGFEVVRKMVNQLEGSMQIERIGQKGTSVQVSIPLLVDYEASVQMDESQMWSGLRGKRVVIAEDNELCSEILQAMLSEVGVLFDTAQDGRQCVELIEQHDESYYDAVLMDIQMPVMDGYEAATTIRSMDNEKKSYLPIIAVTSEVFNDGVVRAIDAGMNGFISKPVDAETLLDAMVKVIH